MARVRKNAVGKAYFHALRFLEMPDALSAFGRIDDEDVFARRDCLVRALHFAHAAIDTVRIDQ